MKEEGSRALAAAARSVTTVRPPVIPDPIRDLSRDRGPGLMAGVTGLYETDSYNGICRFTSL